MLGREIPASELAQVGFVNKVFQDKSNFRKKEREYLQQTFGDKASGSKVPHILI